MRADRVERVVGARLGSSFDEGGGGDDSGGRPHKLCRDRGDGAPRYAMGQAGGLLDYGKVSTTAGVDLEGGPVARGGIRKRSPTERSSSESLQIIRFDVRAGMSATAGAVGNDKKVKKLRRREEEEEEEGKCAKNQLSEQRDTHRGASNSTTSSICSGGAEAATGATNMAKQSVSSKEKRRNVRALKQQCLQRWWFGGVPGTLAKKRNFKPQRRRMRFIFPLG